jgi:Spy/CpxP family protein refolding chaperone
MAVAVGLLMVSLAMTFTAGTASADGQGDPVGPRDPIGAGSFTMNQTLSEQAQENTIAFDALAFLTGSLGADSFFPPGKVADMWGFQYLRDNDLSRMGHNTDFLTKAANNMLYVLNDEQRAELMALAAAQVDDINQYGMDRLVIIDAFCRLLSGDVPENSTGLSLEAVTEYSAELYLLDGQMCLERAEVMGGILSSLDPEQRAYLDQLRGVGMLEWPDVADQINARNMSHDEHVAVMTYAGDMLSWYLGSVEADVYFCPERQGTYFGSFYLKDAPAMGNPNYTINETITGNSGSLFMDTLTAAQAKIITDLVDLQKPYLEEIVSIRENVSAQLRLFMSGGTPDEASVFSLMERYGELDGIIVYHFATAFAQINETLTAEQRAELAALRADLGVSVPPGAFLYSQAIDMPTIEDTDFLFESSPSTDNTPAVTTSPDGNGSSLIAIGIAACAVLLIIGIFLALRGRGGSKGG